MKKYNHVEAGHKAQQRTHLPHVSRAAVFYPSRTKVAATNPTVPKLLDTQNSGKTNTKHHNVTPQQPPFAVAPLLRPTIPGALPAVDHGYQHKVKTKKG
jgi:hypothetical protein